MVRSIFKKRVGNIDFVDITFVIILFMFWVFMANAWKDPLSNTMLALCSVILTFYLIAKYTGVLKSLELTRPVWTLTALISIPIWLFTFYILPPAGGDLPASAIVPNMVEFFIKPESATIALQVFGFAIVESIIAGILAAFFIGVGKKRAQGNVKKQKYNIIGVILMIAIFMAFLHISLTVKLAEAGVLPPEIMWGHQILSFGLLLIGFAIFNPLFAMVIMVAPHITKNLLVYGSGNTGAWIAAITFFIVMDVMSFFFAKKKEQREVVSGLKAFIR